MDAADAANKVASVYGNAMTAGGMGGLGGLGGGGGSGGGGGTPDLSGGMNLNTGQFPGESLPSGLTQFNQAAYPVGGQYGPVGVGGYSQYNPASALGGSIYGSALSGQPYAAPAYGSYSPYGLSAYGYAPQNPYAQYGAHF